MGIWFNLIFSNGGFTRPILESLRCWPCGLKYFSEFCAVIRLAFLVLILCHSWISTTPLNVSSSLFSATVLSLVFGRGNLTSKLTLISLFESLKSQFRLPQFVQSIITFRFNFFGLSAMSSVSYQK